MRNVIMKNNVIYTKKGDSDMKKYGTRMPYVMMYLLANNNNFDICHFNIKNMIEFSGETPKKGKGFNINETKDCVKKLADDGYITDLSADIDNIKVNDYVSCKLNFIANDNEFFMTNPEDILKILGYKGKINRIELLNTYLYIKCRYNTQLHYFFDTVENICKDLCISNKTFDKYIKILKELDILYYGNIGRVNGKIANNIYSFDQEGLNKGLNDSRKHHGIKEVKEIIKPIKSVKVNKAKDEVMNDVEKAYYTVTNEKLTKSYKDYTTELVKTYGEDIVLKAIEQASEEYNKHDNIQNPNAYLKGIINNIVEKVKEAEYERNHTLTILESRMSCNENFDTMEAQENNSHNGQCKNKVWDLLSSTMII